MYCEFDSKFLTEKKAFLIIFLLHRRKSPIVIGELRLRTKEQLIIVSVFFILALVLTGYHSKIRFSLAIGGIGKKKRLENFVHGGRGLEIYSCCNLFCVFAITFELKEKMTGCWPSC